VNSLIGSSPDDAKMRDVRSERALAVVREIGNVAAWMQNGCYLLIGVASRKNRIDIDKFFLPFGSEKKSPISDPETKVPLELACEGTNVFMK
jgi:hypothetical protein